MSDSTRRWPRLKLALRVTLRAESIEEAALTINVSREGLFVRTPDPRPVGTRVEVVIALATGESFHAEGIVVHIHPDPDDPGRAAPDRPAGMGVFLTATTAGWRELCDRLERTRSASPDLR